MLPSVRAQLNYGSQAYTDHRGLTDSERTVKYNECRTISACVLLEYGDITFDVVFKTAPAEAITVVVFAEYEEELILDGMNNVRVIWDG